MKWEKVKLGSILETLTDYHANGSYEKLKENIELLNEPDYAVMIRTKNLESNDFQQDLKYITQSAYDFLKKSKVFSNDILMNKIANAGSVYLMPEIEKPASLAMNLFLIRVAAQKANQIFIFYQLKFRETYIKQFSSGTATQTITKEAVRNLEIYLPSIETQNRIASFLGTVDRRLTQLRRKQELLQTYKRGVMQKIFSQQIRFTQPDGSPFPDWENKTVENVFDWIKTNSLSREALNYDSGTVQNIHYGDIHSKFKSQFRLKDEEVPYITDSEFISNLDNESFCKVGDLVIADASEDYADIGKTIEIIEVEPKKLVAGLHCFIARPKGNLLTVGFPGYLFQTENIKNQIRRIAQGISVLGISKSNLGGILLPCPHPLEQEKIAKFLTAIDQKIEAISQKINHTKQFKKGLLQKMFV